MIKELITLEKKLQLKVQYAWDQEFENPIDVVLGNEWNAGNLSYHLKI